MSTSNEQIYRILLEIKEDTGKLKSDISSLKSDVTNIQNITDKHQDFISNIKGKMTIIVAITGSAVGLAVSWITKQL